MKLLIAILVALLCSPSLIAAPGGGHHKITAYDYHDYLNPAIQSKTFAYLWNGVVYDLVWTFDRSTPNEVIRIDEVFDANDDLVRYQTRTFKPTAESFDVVQVESYDTGYDPPVVYDTVDFTPPRVILTSAMVPGIAWGSAGVQNGTSSGQQLFTDKVEVLAVGEVSVSAGAFEDCLKIHGVHHFSGAGSAHGQMDWFCPGMGLVQRIHSRELLDLVSVTYNE